MFATIVLLAQIAAITQAPPTSSPNRVTFVALGMLQDRIELTVDFDTRNASYLSTVGRGPNASMAPSQRQLTPAQVSGLKRLAAEALATGLEAEACVKDRANGLTAMPNDGMTRMVVTVDGREDSAPKSRNCWSAKATALLAATSVAVNPPRGDATK
jgi:hypothetical protein